MLQHSHSLGIPTENCHKKNSFQTLPYAADDAKAVRDYLIRHLDFDPTRIFSLENSAATRQRIQQLLGDELPHQVKAEDRLLVYFSGHGATTGSEERPFGFLVPVDGDDKKLYSTAISMNEISAYSDRIPAKQILFVIDACYSGITGAFYHKGNELTEVTRKQVETFINSNGRQIMTAGRRGDRARVSKNGH